MGQWVATGCNGEEGEGGRGGREEGEEERGVKKGDEGEKEGGR